MSNIAGKAFAMNLITPIERKQVKWNKLAFWALTKSPLRDFVNWFLKRLNFDLTAKLSGLITLSMIHYARWVIVLPDEWPRLEKSQPPEELDYAYQFFFSNFNGSWAQYVDSFSAAIPDGLDALWNKNVNWPTSVPQGPFHRYVEHNEVWTDYYYSAYPMAASNDVKAAQRLKKELVDFITKTETMDAPEFQREYDHLLNSLQGDPHAGTFPCLGQMAPTPVVSLASVARRPDRVEYRSLAEAPDGE
jgi:hypothetical protein